MSESLIALTRMFSLITALGILYFELYVNIKVMVTYGAAGPTPRSIIILIAGFLFFLVAHIINKK